MNKILANRFFLVGFVVLIVVFSLSLRKTRLKSEYSAYVLKQKEAGVAELKSEVESLKKKNQSLDDEYVQEKIIRDELLMQKPEEIVFQLPPELAQPSPSPTPTPTPANIYKWKNLLLH